MSKFKVGDKVWFLPDEVNKIDPNNIWVSSMDEKRLYTITKREGNTIWLDEPNGFVFSPFWLKKAEEYKGEVKKEAKLEVKVMEGRIENVVFSGPATIVFWTDGTKTVVKCRKGDKFDPEKGIAMACAKKLLGNEDGYHKTIEKYLTKSKTPSGGIESMDTDEIRTAVWKGCHTFSIDGCRTKCPCKIDRTCCTIGRGTRDQLIKMLKSFEKAEYFSYDDWRMHHA